MEETLGVFQPAIEQLTSVAGGYAMNLLGAIVILVVGWLLALVVSSVTHTILRRMLRNSPIARWLSADGSAESVPVERYASSAIFYLVMLFVLVAFFQTLRLTTVTEPLNALLQTIIGFVPQLIAAGVLLAVAVAVASVVRRAVTFAAGHLRIDGRFGDDIADNSERLARTLGDGVYWFILLLFLPAVLSALAIEGLLLPVQELLQRILGFLPSIFGAAVILAAGWFLAKFVRHAASNLLAAAGLDRLSEAVGLHRALGTSRLSDLAGLILHVLVLVPVAMAALDALSLEAITEPASAMLARALGAIPSLFAAALLLAVSYVAATLVAGLVTRVLGAAGFDELLARLGISLRDDALRQPSALAGALVVPVIMLLASMEAAALVGFSNLSSLVAEFLLFGANMLLGLVILGIGLFLSRAAADAIRSSGTSQASALAFAARGSIIVLSATMALQQMGLGAEIITLAFGILAGSVGVAAAIAFGLGARDTAGQSVERWVKRLQDRESRTE